MPRKTKDQKELEKESKQSTKKVSSSKSSTKKTTAKSTSKKNTSKKTTAKSSSKKDTSKAKRTTTKNSNKKFDIVEYYDLPYRYNETIVKVLAQTPNTLFIYWDISDSDRENFKKIYGENFFEITKPILIIHNSSLGYSFEVEINDFANSWYLHVQDSKCDYKIELVRKPINQYTYEQNSESKPLDNYIFISNSNKIESPNDHILLNQNQKMIYFRNVKTGNETGKSISFIQNLGKIYNIYDLYTNLYQNDNIEDIYNSSNPSSI